MKQPCILETVDADGTYSCFVRDYDLWCPFATEEGLEKYSCRSGTGKLAISGHYPPKDEVE